ncbi:MAG: class I SAM-dependent methyltransferase [Planctomycetota bacterium]|nr:class I SAM-dependent methyltransferase [Planctomycetota bacterium]
MIHATSDKPSAHGRSVTPNAILSDILAELVTRANSGETETPAFRTRLTQAADLAAGLDPYLENYSTAPSAPLASLMQQTHNFDWADVVRKGDVSKLVEKEMLSGPVEAIFLQMLLRVSGAVRVLDIGMFTGYSALAMAEAIPEEGVVVGCEVEPHVAEFARTAIDTSGSPHANKIRIRIGDAASTLRELAAEQAIFDFVFLDADKANYLHYLTILRKQRMLAEGALICVDNTLMQGEPYTRIRSPNGKSIHDFNQFVAQDDSLTQVIVPLRDGITLIQVNE